MENEAQGEEWSDKAVEVVVWKYDLAYDELCREDLKRGGKYGNKCYL